MSQGKSTNENSQETRKKILLGGLGAVLLIVVYFQFFSGGSGRPTTPAQAARANASPSPGARPAAPRTGAKAETIISQPLDLAVMVNKNAPSGTGRNIFVYPPPPTPKPIPPPSPTPTPVPPPITIFSLNPAGVVARTAEFTLSVFGDKIPPDAQGYVNGQEFQTTFVAATEVKIRVPAEAIRTAGNLGIQVRSKSDAKLFSNQATVNVAEPPAPPYKFVGLIVDRKGSLAVLKGATEEDNVNVVKGQTFGRRWKALAITSQRIEIEDVTNKISHFINFTAEN
jgi:hypothetical protein